MEPSGPVTLTFSIVPFIPRVRASTVPSPPSAKGQTVTSASRNTRCIPSETAFPASKELKLPFIESMATTTFIRWPPVWFCDVNLL